MYGYLPLLLLLLVALLTIYSWTAVECEAAGRAHNHHQQQLKHGIGMAPLMGGPVVVLGHTSIFKRTYLQIDLRLFELCHSDCSESSTDCQTTCTRTQGLDLGLLLMGGLLVG